MERQDLETGSGANGTHVESKRGSRTLPPVWSLLDMIMSEVVPTAQ
jgi:hypothetical protein